MFLLNIKQKLIICGEISVCLEVSAAQQRWRPKSKKKRRMLSFSLFVFAKVDLPFMLV